MKMVAVGAFEMSRLACCGKGRAGSRLGATQKCALDGRRMQIRRESKLFESRVGDKR